MPTHYHLAVYIEGVYLRFVLGGPELRNFSVRKNSNRILNVQATEHCNDRCPSVDYINLCAAIIVPSPEGAIVCTYTYNRTAWVSALLVQVCMGNATALKSGTSDRDSPAFFMSNT